MVLKDDLLGWLEHAKGEYAARKKTAEARVVRWEWFTSGDRALQPFYFERNRFSRGKRLLIEPSLPREGYVAYGVDAQDRVLVEREYAEHGRFYEIFYQYLAEKVEWVRYDYSSDKHPVAVHCANFAGERIVSLTMRGIGGGSAERYLYCEERIVRIEREVLQAEAFRHESQAWTDRFEIQWDDLGRVSRITQSGDDESRLHTIFQRPTKEERLKDLVAILEAELVAQIPKGVGALGLKEPAYSLVLAYDDEGNDMLPPAIGVGLAQERSEWLATRSSDARWLVWNPAEYRHYNCDPLAFYDQKLLALCDKANQQIAMNDQWSVGRTLLDRVATSLRGIAWKAMMPVTEDFVVYAVDFELGNLRKSLRKAAGARQFELWQGGGHVP